MAGLAAAGAAAGTAIMPGIGTAIGGVLGAVGDAFMDDKGGGSVAHMAPAAPSSMATNVAVYGSGLSADAWNVNFSGGVQRNDTATGSRDISASQSADARATSAPTLPTYLTPQSSNGLDIVPGAMVAGEFLGLPWYVWAVGVVVIWKLRR